MKHLNSGDLRRMIDEPQAFSDETRRHVTACDECRSRSEDVRIHADRAAGALGGTIAADAAAAYRRLQERTAPEPAMRRWYSTALAGALAAVFAIALLFTPLGGYARSFLTIFEPQQFQPIEISRADLRSLHVLPQAGDVGTQRVLRKPQTVKFASIAAAQQHTTFALRRPNVLPPRFDIHSYSVMSPGAMSFTFSAAKARAFEKRSHKTLAPMPPGLDGTTVSLQTGQVFRARYDAGQPGASRGSDSEFFDLIEAAVPRVTSSGASLDTLERYLLSMPNVSPSLAAQIRALGDIQNTIPVPVVIDKQTARHVTVDGVNGLAIGDNTGLGAGVMWQKNGLIYVVAGPLSMSEVMTVANGLR